MSDNKRILWVIIIVLAAGALSLGYGVYKRSNPSAEVADTAVSANGAKPAAGVEQKKSVQVRKLSAEETKVLSGVSLGATESERTAYTDLVNVLARKAGQISVSECYGDPLVAVVSKTAGEAVFANKDAVSRLLAFNNGKDKQTLGAGETRTLKLNFPNGLGFYTYTCDNQTSGLMLVEE